MTCRQCQGLESLFDQKTAANELEKYRRKGPANTTRLLIEALNAEGVMNKTLLDIGGGIGSIQHELVKAGINQVINVDASSAYIAAAKTEAKRQGYLDRATYYHGNFVDLARDIPAVDIVTLDRAICCYHDMPALVGLSSTRANYLYGVVYPRNSWWVRFGVNLLNLGAWLIRQAYRFFVHPTEVVETILETNGFQRRFYHQTLIWQVVVYGR